MALHTIEPERRTLHGQFSRDLAPALMIEPGEIVRYATLDVGWGMEQHGAPGTPRAKFGPRVPPLDDGPALCGPVAIRGAEAGMTLEIVIETVRPTSWGWTYAGRSSFNEKLFSAVGLADAPDALVRWSLDADAMRGTNEHGVEIPLRPFLGIIGMPPAEPGLHDGWTPRRTGGNMDCTALIAGNTLYLPVAAPGGLVSVGDGHATQGDGEVCGSAIECPMECVELRYLLRDDLRVGGPRVRTDAGWITLGFGRDLDEAAGAALSEMLDMIEQGLGIGRMESMALASAVVDLRVTQMANPLVGAHAFLPHGILHGDSPRADISG